MPPDDPRCSTEETIDNSSSLEFANLSGISNKEQEQVIEDAILAKIDEVLPESRVPQVINDVARDEEITTSHEQEDLSKIYDNPTNSAVRCVSFLLSFVTTD